MAVGFAILAHQRLDRAAALAAYLADHGVPVVVHLDRRAADPGPLAGIPGVTVLQTRRADWGGFGLVDATLDCVDALLRGRTIGHIALLSGSCLPLRPLPDLAGMLAENPDRDFIESVPLSGNRWVQGGLSIERFTLYHPFCWRRNRLLFDAAVRVQRGLGVRRRLPDGLEPHLGLQWWCLSIRTLRALMNDPRLPAWRRFFRTTWIPDEGFFQTLVRALRPGAGVGPPLHLARFDPRGRPYAFHDDHTGLLARSGAWFARKVDPDADVLYRRFLGDGVVAGPRDSEATEAAFHAARQRERREGAGALSAARYPHGISQASVPTAAPYLALVADDPASACAALSIDPGLAVHGQLFSGTRPRFAGVEVLHRGNLWAGPGIRAYRPAQFLAMTVRADRAAGRRSVFGVSPVGRTTVRSPCLAGWQSAIGRQIAGDPNARLVLLGDPRTMLGRLRRPGSGCHAGPPAPLRAWWADCRPGGVGSNSLSRLVASDWADPAGWTVPAEPPGGWPS